MLSTAEAKTSSSRPWRETIESPCGGAWSRSGNGAASASARAASASMLGVYTFGRSQVRRVRLKPDPALLRRAGVVDVHGERIEAVAEGVADRPDLAALAEHGQRAAVQQCLVHRRVDRVVRRVDRDHV